MSVARRIIPCLDVRDGRVVKGTRFTAHRDCGDILELAQRYRDEGADELVFYDISASPAGRTVDVAWVAEVARILDIPFCVAGGISSVAAAERILNAGADKVSVNTPALETPELIDELATRFGMQCVVVGVDSRRSDDDWYVFSHTGDANTIRRNGRRLRDWLQEVQERGAGEVVLNCMDSDGVRDGYDLEQLAVARSLCTVPLVASGGAGSVADFTKVFRDVDVDAALAASVFHSGAIAIPELKQSLSREGVRIRI